MKLQIVSRRIDYLFFLVAFHVVLLALCFLEHIPNRALLRVATGDAELALGVLLAVCLPAGIGFRLLLGGLLVLAAALLHYISAVFLVYPMVFAEQYFLSLGTAAAITAALAWPRRRLIRQSSDGASSRSAKWNPRAVSLKEWLAVPVVLGVGILLVRQSLTLTDLSGIADPWESLSWISVELPTYALACAPLLAAAWMLYAVLWTWPAELLLADRPWTLRRAVEIPLVFLLLVTGEAVIAAGYLCFDKPVPLLPTTMLYNVIMTQYAQTWLWERRPDFAARLWGTALAVATIRLYSFLIFGGSLLALRWAGWRMATEPAEDS